MLLVAGLMLLVDDDQAQTLEGQEDGRASSQDDFIGILRQLFLPYFHAFSITVLGMIDTQLVAEDALQPLHHLHRQGYLRQQVEHLLFTLQCQLDQMDVYLRLAAARHTM